MKSAFPPTAPQSEFQVLLVEDNPGDARLLQLELAEARVVIHMTLAKRLDAGIEMLAARQFDLILLDLHLPDSSGIETFRRMSEQAGDTPIVVLSGMDDETVGIGAVHAGAQDYLVKGQTSAGLLERTIRYAVQRAQSATRQRHQLSFMSAITDSLGEGVCAVDPEMRITFVNPAAERLLGWSRQDLTGRVFGEAFGNESVEHAIAPLQALREALRTGQSVPSENGDLLRQDGTGFAVSATASPILEDGAIAGAVLVFRDVTERREVERVKREFVSTVSHELRTPLTSIRGSLSLLSSGVMGELSPAVQGLMDVASRNVLRLIALINDILDFERLEDHRLPLEDEPVVLANVISQAFETLQGFAEQEEIRLESGHVGGQVRGDAGRLSQVLVNLISNAVKFSVRGSAVTVETIEHADDVEVRVIDRGRGVPAEFRSRIFERFQQVDSSDSRRHGGTGLGLAICKLIIEQHGGTIGVESEESRGSTFWFRLPALDPADVRGQASTEPSSHAGSPS